MYIFIYIYIFIYMYIYIVFGLRYSFPIDPLVHLSALSVDLFICHGSILLKPHRVRRLASRATLASACELYASCSRSSTGIWAWFFAAPS